MLKIYFLETQYTYWNWMDVFLELVLYLQEKYPVKLIHQKGGRLQLEKYNYSLPDCEILIEDEENDILRGITFSESGTNIINSVFAQRNNKNDILLLSQFYNFFPRDFDKSVYNFSIKPTTFFPMSPKYNLDYWYHQRKFNGYNNLIDKMFCLTSTGRPVVDQLRQTDLLGPPDPTNLPYEMYYDTAIKYKIGFDTPGNAEICHRGIEYMGIGLPMLRMEYMTQLEPKLIPNYHYIAVDREGFPWDMYADRNGGPEYVKAYEKRFLEVKDDYEFLSFIAKNARQYYVENCSFHNRLKYILKTFNL